MFTLQHFITAILILLAIVVTNAAGHECSVNHPAMCIGFNFNTWKRDHPNLYMNKLHSRAGGAAPNTKQPSARERQELITLTTNALKKLDHLTDVQQEEAMTQWEALVFNFAWSTSDLKGPYGGSYPYGVNVGGVSTVLLDQMSQMELIHPWNRLGKTFQQNGAQHEDLKSSSDYFLNKAKETSKLLEKFWFFIFCQKYAILCCTRHTNIHNIRLFRRIYF